MGKKTVAKQKAEETEKIEEDGKNVSN